MQKNKITLSIFVIILSISNNLFAQKTFPKEFIGVWEGKMQIYKNGEIKDSVNTRQTIAESSEPDTWIWRTDYFSKLDTIVKDYLLKVIDKEKNHYAIDEQDGISLDCVLHQNKLFSSFSVQGNILTTSYQIIEDKLVFEVIMAYKVESEKGQVKSFLPSIYQKSILKKVNSGFND